jgi:ABC-type sugar transport system substrate-binding protein
VRSPTHLPAPSPGRRRFLRWALAGVAAAACLCSGGEATGQARRYTVAFANLTEEPGITLEGTGFTGRDVREGFALAARPHPLDLVFYDNQRGNARALANAEDAIAKKVDLYILYHRDPATNAAIVGKLKAAGIPVLAFNHAAAAAPLYTIDNMAAGRLAGETLGDFAVRNWRAQPKVAVVLGPLGAQAERIPERVQGVTEGLKRHLPNVRVTMLDTQGNPAHVGALLGKLLQAQPAGKLLIATTDDATALAAKSALESAGRLQDAAIVSHGVDRSIHGGMNEKKEIDPNNRGSIVIGSIAFYLDRAGYDVLPLALAMLKGQAPPPRTAVAHRLITAANVFIEYPPSDMN